MLNKTNKAAIKEDLQMATMAATVVTIIVTLIEVPIVWVYLIVKWLTAFIGAMLGLLGLRLIQWAWNKYKAK